MIQRFFSLLLASVAFFSCQNEHSNLPDGLYADIETNKGTITVALEFEKTPITVANFVSLAEGKNNFVTGDYKGKPFYNGLKWHRVIKDFVIQGGDPLGNGTGDAGYRFKDEIVPELQFDNGGVLAMANSGPATNGSQFFITHIPTPQLNGRHTIFGHVVENGMETVNQIEQDDEIVSIKIIRKGEAAKKFNAAKIFADFFANESENQKKQAAIDAENKKIYEAKSQVIKAKKTAELAAIKKTAEKSTTGLIYKIVKKGSGKKPAIGADVLIHYAGFLENGELFDSSIESVATEYGKFDQNRANQRGYDPIVFKYGRKDGMIPGFIEGIEKMNLGDKAVLFIPSELAYGPQGAGNGVIPPNANIIFEIELLDK